jgi:Protein of unknown function (DUF4232)
MLCRTPSLLASLAVVAALCGAAGPLAAQTAPPVLVDTPAPAATPGAVTTSAPVAPPAPNAPSMPPEVRPCAPSDLVLREVGKTGSAGTAAWVYAVKNRSGSACRLIGSVGFRLFDAHGNELRLQFAPRTMMAMLVTLPPVNEASFSASYAPQYTTNTATYCKRSARIEVLFPDQRAPLSAKSTMPACTGLLVRASNLRLSVASTVVPTPASLVS